MGRLKCCVRGCDATSDTHRLFSLPKNDHLRSLWMSFLVPYNPLLLGLSKDQLIAKRVCIQHFDKQQFDQEGRRLRYSYPCLFTVKEIFHGVPLNKEDWSAVAEHNYSRIQVEDEDISNLTLDTKRADDANFHDYPSCSYTEAPKGASHNFVDYQLIDKPTISFEHQQTVTARTTVNDSLHDGNERPMRGGSNVNKNLMKKQIVNRKRAMMKKHKIVKTIKKIAAENHENSVEEKLEQAQILVKDMKLLQNFNKLSKQVKCFILLQLKLATRNKMARKFTLDEKLMCLTFLKHSPKGYKLLEKMFALPTKRTLSKLSQRITFEPGLNNMIFEHIKKCTQNWDIEKKLCTIVFDEVALTPHLIFNEKKDLIEGFVDVAGKRKLKYCDHALVFMVRGINFSWRQCVAYYFCEGTVSAVELMACLSQIVLKVSDSGLIPLGLVCDQGSTFRTAIRILRQETLKKRNSEGVLDDGTISVEGHNLFIFFDPPHLKGIRNNFLNKDISFENKIASWKDIEFIFNIDSSLGHTRAIPKLTQYHVNPKTMKKMKVSVAAQVLSNKVAAMLRYTDSISNLYSSETNTLASTADVIEFFDKLFDSVNGYPGGAIRGKLRNAVKPNSNHLSFWKQAILKLRKVHFIDRYSKLAIRTGQPRNVRVPSLEGWITTLDSFIGLSKLLFDTYNIEYFYPRRINQDPLENFFGRVRAINYRNVNPNANMFSFSFKSLVLSNILAPHSQLSNCQEDNGDTILDVNFLFDITDGDKENVSPNINLSSQQLPSQQISLHSDLLSQFDMEKVKVHCSAYTAGYICRKISKIVNCKSCANTYTSKDIRNIHRFIQLREYKMNKNSNLIYPTETFIEMYREASHYIHSYLNEYAANKNVGSVLEHFLLERLDLSWLGCTLHKEIVKEKFIKVVKKVQMHNWCNIINKILSGAIEKKQVDKMFEPQKMAYKKYVTYRLRKKSTKSN